jgi:hypothetical protein
MKNLKHPQLLALGLILLILLLMSSCAQVHDVKPCIKTADHICGFWHGAWHGMVMDIALIGKFFDNDIAIYSVNNNGWWYDFGFVIGLTGGIKIIILIIKAIGKILF